jgi:hypothetical protein
MQRAYVWKSLSSRFLISNSLVVFIVLMAGLAAAQSAARPLPACWEKDVSVSPHAPPRPTRLRPRNPAAKQ